MLRSGSMNILSSIKHAGDRDVEEDFEELISNMGLGDEQKADMRRLSYDKKEQLLLSKKNMDKLEKKKKKKNSLAPEDYSGIFLSATEPIMDSSILVGLRVYLATSPIDWADRFINGNGIESLLKYMSLINSSPTTSQILATQELELVRCLQTLINITQGADKAYSSENMCRTLCLSIDGMETETRHLVSQLLTFACYHSSESYSMVVSGFEYLWKARKTEHAFDPWVSKLLSSANAVLRKRSRGDSKTVVDLEECILSNFILVNSLVSINPSLNMRVACRDELEKSGFNKVIEKASSFNNSLMEYQISKYENEGLEDAIRIEEEYNRFVFEDIVSIEQASEALINRVISPADREDLLSIFKDILLVTPEQWGSVNPLNRIRNALPALMKQNKFNDKRESDIDSYKSYGSDDSINTSADGDLVSRMSKKFDRDQELDIFQSVIEENKEMKSKLNKALNEIKSLTSELDEKSG
ncbi:Cytokinesis protein sepA [Smittium mucronatum]|uniref:Cytokinesis protein sepA n=1 Tax=Smittium mucronatum TaxID=133383 RepID=A0A1R0H099_9FUNG|nr:Cytokinesis protein sepA [Smittium mucronatum]